MNDTILGIVIGGVLTMIPTLYNSWLSRHDHHDQRMHELRLKRYDSIVAPNIDAIMNYAEKLGPAYPHSSLEVHRPIMRICFASISQPMSGYIRMCPCKHAAQWRQSKTRVNLRLVIAKSSR